MGGKRKEPDGSNIDPDSDEAPRVLNSISYATTSSICSILLTLQCYPKPEEEEAGHTYWCPGQLESCCERGETKARSSKAKGK
jgi:hypothetical protein